MADTLYIIGNGFDLHHGLRTSYTDFREYIKQKCSYLWNLLSDIYGDALYDNMWWCNFEEMLAQINFLHLMKSKNREALGSMKIRNLLKGSLPPLLGSWIKKIGCNVDPDHSLGINLNPLFFSFNYTMLLEIVYGVKEDNVWHIHDSIKRPDDIVIGHDSDYRELFVRFNQFRDDHPEEYIRMDITDMIIQEVANGAKKVKERIAQNENRFYDQYSWVKHFIAMGFSFNDIDMPYIEKIWSVNRHKDEANWTVYLHTPEDESIIGRIIGLGVNERNIHTKNW